MNINKLQKVICAPTLITDEKMIDYLIGQHFHVSERFLGLLISNTEAKLFLNNLFPTDLKNLEIIRFSDTDDVVSLLSQHLSHKTLYVDKHLRAEFLLKLMHSLPHLDVQIDTQADQVRSIKDKLEQEKMRKASKINDSVMSLVPSLLKLGVTELEVAEGITQLFKDLGADQISFGSIVAFGDHGADPHAMPSERTLKENESIIIDMGCVKDGYCSDMTRTFFINNNPYQNVYDLVKNANLAAEAMIKPGVRFSDIDKAARDVIEKAGYGEYFIHRTGHGIGKDVHEPYDVSSSNDMIVQEGMCFSIEPGIYLEGQVGVRIEDLVLVTKDGCEVLNQYPKDKEVLKR